MSRDTQTSTSDTLVRVAGAKNANGSYALPDGTGVRVTCWRPADAYSPSWCNECDRWLDEGCDTQCSCQGRGWNASMDLAVLAKAGWPVMEKLSETETKGTKWYENWMLFDTYKTACAKGDLEGATRALAQALVAEGATLYEEVRYE